MTTESQKYLPGIIKGYKATDANVCCRGLQYTPGEWQEVGNADELIKCGGNGLHFCLYPSGPWAFYSEAGTRLWECEAEYVLDEPVEPGADAKRVCRRLRLVKEIVPDGQGNTGNRNTGNRNTGDQNTGDQNTGDQNTGNRNTGHWNTGNWNTGDQNTGDQNTGDQNTGNRNTGNWNTGDQNTGDQNTGDQNTGNRNTGHWNTGNRNTGNRNTGHWNTGDQNTGDQNTGNRNTGHWNTGHWNTGHWNTGNRNTGNRNTGDGNATDNCSGFFCDEEPPVRVFNKNTKLTRQEFMDQFPEYWELCNALHSQEPIPLGPYARIPGITSKKLKALHAKHLAAKKAQ